MPPMPSINSVLSQDLILDILDHLAVPLAFHERKCDLPVLSACSQVCRVWSSQSQRLLFRRVIIPHNIHRLPYLRGTSRNALPSFLDAIDPTTERGRHLGSCVLSFTLRHTGRDADVVVTYPVWLATALLRTPNLRHLNVTTLLCDFTQEALEDIRKRGPKITSLCILQDFSPAVVQHRRIMHQLVAAFPTIRLLEVTANLSPTLTPFDPPVSLALVSVKFNAMLATDFGPCLASLMQKPTEEGEVDSPPKHSEGLQLISHTSTRDSRPTLSAILNQHASSLRSLSLKTVALDSPESQAALRNCTRLERLELGTLPSSSSTSIAASLFALPPTLTTLLIGGPRAAPPDPLAVEALTRHIQMDSALPKLRTLSWHVSGSSPTQELIEVCRGRGVELNVRTGPGVNVDVGLLDGGRDGGDLIEENAVEVELRRKYLRI
ncbi:hypothetical protein FB45DRAFT_944560 [Roridomyces roridus]|uniref:F-box domain-containing protein n=1 Tax=Roridomyces roridus TaxID=1738132 RepID=A0AAD7B3B3_9AGAR|nr:hypothetical protein FB45DRAFT_944560 [Roridomyces roridus]